MRRLAMSCVPGSRLCVASSPGTGSPRRSASSLAACMGPSTPQQFVWCASRSARRPAGLYAGRVRGCGRRSVRGGEEAEGALKTRWRGTALASPDAPG